MLKQIHQSHIGMEGCLRRAREVLYWPLMNAEVEDFISKCSVCQSYKPDQCREDMHPYPVPSRPWSMLAADLFELEISSSSSLSTTGAGSLKSRR